jgi:tetratricopeptide (TPR) repeat protein
MDIHRKLAEEYMNQGLYEKAIDSYERYIDSPYLTLEKRSNISYIIGNIYMDDLSDYNNALASFIRAKTYYPSNVSVSEINKKIIACLEKLGKSIDAEREMSKITSLTQQEKQELDKSKDEEIIVAKIGERNISMRELNNRIQNLPSFARDNYREKDKKIEFLNQYVTEELLYDSAKKRGMDNDRDIIEGTNEAKKQLMLQRLIKEEVEAKVAEPDESDLKLYYDAHKDKYMEEKKDDANNVTKRQKEFNEVKDAVRFEYMTMKREERFKDFVKNLATSRDIMRYEDAFKEK